MMHRDALDQRNENDNILNLVTFSGFQRTGWINVYETSLMCQVVYVSSHVILKITHFTVEEAEVHWDNLICPHHPPSVLSSWNLNLVNLRLFLPHHQFCWYYSNLSGLVLSWVQLFAIPWTVACQDLLGPQGTWDFPGKDTGVGCHFLLQEIFPTQGLNPCLFTTWFSFTFNLLQPAFCSTEDLHIAECEVHIVGPVFVS